MKAVENRVRFVNLLKSMWNKSLKIKILSCFIVLSVLSFSIMFYLVHNAYHKASVTQLGIASRQSIQALQLNIDLFINEIHALALDIYSNTRINNYLLDYNLDPESVGYIKQTSIISAIKEYLFHRDYIIDIRIYTREAVFYGSRTTISLINDPFKGSIWEEKAYSADGRIVTIPAYEQAYNASESKLKKSYKVVALTRVLKNLKEIYKNEKIGFIVIDFDEEYLKNVYSGIIPSSYSFVVLTENNGNVISSSNSELNGLNIYTDEYFDTLRDQGDGSVTATRGKKNYLILSTSLASFGWRLYLCSSINDFFSGGKAFTTSLLIFTVLLVAGNFLISYFVTAALFKPLTYVSAAIKRIKEGDLSSRIEILSQDEIGEVSIQFNQMIETVEKLVKENYEIRLHEKDAELESLQAKIHPHFLYNTLDTISWKVTLAGCSEINELITALGDLLRFNIRRDNKIITLDENIKQLERYIFIQKARYMDRFLAKYQIAPETRKLFLHKFLIQPVLENAIIHGLEEKTSGGLLCIRSSIREENLVIEVYDNGKGISEDTIKKIFIGTNDGNHIGLLNVHKRIQLYYGEAYGVQIESKVGEYTTVRLILPQIKELERINANGNDCR
ncbi:MAG: sensor histidine kinase [Spirochaetota bacterium]